HRDDLSRVDPRITGTDAHVLVHAVVGRGDPAVLLELAVRGEVLLGGDGDDLAAVDGDRTVVQAVAVSGAQRGAEHDDRQQLTAGLDHRGDRLLGKIGRAQV